MPAVVSNHAFQAGTARHAVAKGCEGPRTSEPSEGEAGAGSFQKSLDAAIQGKSPEKATQGAVSEHAAKPVTKVAGSKDRKVAGRKHGEKAPVEHSEDHDAVDDEPPVDVSDAQAEVESASGDEEGGDAAQAGDEAKTDVPPALDVVPVAVTPQVVVQEVPTAVKAADKESAENTGAVEDFAKAAGEGEMVHSRGKEAADTAQKRSVAEQPQGTEDPTDAIEGEKNPQVQAPRAMPRKEAAGSAGNAQTKASASAETEGEVKNTPAAPVTLPAVAQDAFEKAMADAIKVAAKPEEGPRKESVASPTLTPLQSQEAPKETTSPRAEAASNAQQSPDVDPHDAFEQVVLGLQSKLDPKNGKAEIELNPPNLGKVHVSVTLQNGNLTAQFQSSSDLVRGLLKDNMEKLKTVLEGQGVTVDRLAVNAPSESPSQGQAQGQAFGDAARDGRSNNQYQRDARSGNRRPEADTFSRFFRGPAATSAPIDVVG